MSEVGEFGLGLGIEWKRRLLAAAGSVAMLLTSACGGSGFSDEYEKYMNRSITCIDIETGAKLRKEPAVTSGDAFDNKIIELNFENFYDLKASKKYGAPTIRLSGLNYVKEYHEPNNGTWYGIPSLEFEGKLSAEQVAIIRNGGLNVWVNEAKAHNCSPKAKK